MRNLSQRWSEIEAKLPRPDNKFFWISTAIVFKSLVICFFLYQANVSLGDRMLRGIVFMHNDHGYFQAPVDNYFETGHYEYRKGKPFAGRMPGYTIPYFLIRLVFEKETATVLQIFTQMLLSFIAVYYLALSARLIFNEDRYFYLTFALFLISIFTNTYDFFTLAESYAVSAIIFFIYFLLLYLKQDRLIYLFISGLFLTWAIFCRPYLGLLIVAVPVILLFYLWQDRLLKEITVILAVFLASFILIESAWIVRNYAVLNKFIPLESGFEESYDLCIHKDARTEINNLIMSWGGIAAGFYPYMTAGSWFEGQQAEEPHPFPEYAFNAGFNLDSLKVLRAMYTESCDGERTAAYRDSIELEIIQIAKRYKADYQSNNPFRYYVINPLKRVRRYILVSGTNDIVMKPFPEMDLAGKAIKIAFSGLYLFILVFGFIGMVVRIAQKNITSVECILLFIPPLDIIAVLIGTQDAQIRYLAPVFPVLIIWTAYLIITFMEKRNFLSS